MRRTTPIYGSARLQAHPLPKKLAACAACAPTILSARGPEPKLTPYREAEFLGFPWEDGFQHAASTPALARARGPEPKLTPYREAEFSGFP